MTFPTFKCIFKCINRLYITTTELRTKTAELVNLLAAGYEVNLVHRSRLIGEIKRKTQPKKTDIKVFNAKKFLKTVGKLNLPNLTMAERERNYRDHIMKKYGKSISGR